MQMHQVRYFLALCEELNFTRSARRCGVSQPSLTTLGGDARSRRFLRFGYVMFYPVVRFS